jgi:phage shock protein A
MGAAAYNRGSALVSAAADAAMPIATLRAERNADKDENDRLRAQVARLESDLRRARRCIAELRRSKEERIAEHRADSRRSDAAISMLCHIAFPNDPRTNSGGK